MLVDVSSRAPWHKSLVNSVFALVPLRKARHRCELSLEFWYYGLDTTGLTVGTRNEDRRSCRARNDNEGSRGRSELDRQRRMLKTNCAGESKKTHRQNPPRKSHEKGESREGEKGGCCMLWGTVVREHEKEIRNGSLGSAALAKAKVFSRPGCVHQQR